MAEDDFPSLGAAPAKKQAPQQAKPKKQKGKTLALDDWLQEETAGSGSWADEMDSLPSGPSARESGMAGEFGPRGRGAGRADTQGWERSTFDRPEVPLPTAPPFTAYIGNLHYETTEGDLTDFFTPRPLTSVRMVTGHDGKPKGFAYVEFEALEDLKSALTLDGTDLVARRVRVSVAEPPREDRTQSAWRRDGPLPDARGGRGGGAGFTDRPPMDDDDWMGARGARFQPTEEPPRGHGRRDMGSGFHRDAGASGGGFEGDNFARGSRFVPSAPESAPPTTKRFGAPSAAPVGEAENASQWRRAAPLPPSAKSPRSPNFERAPLPSSTDASPPNQSAPAPPMQRKKLELKPRSETADPPAAPQSAPSNKPSPFGAARAVNTADREAEVVRKRQEAREQAEKERAAAAEKKTILGRSSSQEQAQTTQSSAPPAERQWRRSSGSKPRSPEAKPAGVPAQHKPRQPSNSASNNGQNPEKAMRKEGFSFASAAAATAAAESANE